MISLESIVQGGEVWKSETANQKEFVIRKKQFVVCRVVGRCSLAFGVSSWISVSPS